MLVKTSELQGAALDWAVAKCEELDIHSTIRGAVFTWGMVKNSSHLEGGQRYQPSTDWSQGGPLIEREKIELSIDAAEGFRWWAQHQLSDSLESGPCALIAAMRCYVASKMGDEVEVPKELA